MNNDTKLTSGVFCMSRFGRYMDFCEMAQRILPFAKNQMICTVHKISKLAFGERSAQMPIDFGGGRIASLLCHEVPVAVLCLSLPCSSSIAELICTYPGEEVNWHYILKEIRWDQVFQRAWCLPGC